MEDKFLLGNVFETLELSDQLKKSIKLFDSCLDLSDE